MYLMDKLHFSLYLPKYLIFSQCIKLLLILWALCSDYTVEIITVI